MTARLIHFIVYRPALLLVLLSCITVFFAYHARHIEYDSSIESLLPQDDPERAYYEQVIQQFGNDEAGIIGLIADDVYTPAVLEKLARITEALQQIPEVQGVRSLANAEDIIQSVAQETTRLLPNMPPSAAEISALKQKVVEQPIYLKTFVSLDGRAAGISISFTPMTTDEYVRRGVDDKIQEVVDREQGPEQLYYTGLPHFKAYSAKAMAEDMRTLLPIGLLFIIGVLFVSFRSLRGVLLPTVTVIVSLIWTLGLMVLAGSRLSIGTLALPLLILVLGVAYSLHVIATYYELAQRDRRVEDVVQDTVRVVTAPVFLAALTTAVGFLALLVNGIVSIREMGLYAAVGITFAFALSVILTPALLTFFRLPQRADAGAALGIQSALQWLVGRVIRHRSVILISSALIGLLSLWPIPSLRVGSNFLSVFSEQHPVRQAADVVGRHLAGSMGFYVMIDGAEEGIMRKWETLHRIKDLQSYIDSLPGINKTLSLVDAAELVEKGVHAIPPLEGEPPAVKPQPFWEDPTQLEGIFQFFALIPTTIAHIVDYPKYSRTNMLVQTSLSSPSDIAATVEKISAYANEHFPPELRAHPTGKLILQTRTASDLITGQIQSLSLTAVVIFILLAVMFLSVRIGFLAMIPNLFPIVVFFGLMGVTGAVLSPSTSIIASVVLGLAVDDTIHLMTRLSKQVRATTDEGQALLQTFSTVGKPAFYTSVLTFLGFMTLCLSTFMPLREFGVLSAVTVLVVFVGDIVLLPALLTTTRIITLWDLLYLKLGREPHRTISLFAGLRPLQAKIVTLMGELQVFPQGHPILRRGDTGNEMYVLVNGTADVFIATNGAPRRVRTLTRGDVFGEMGLIRRHERTADVVATEDVEVLMVNERFLNRLKRRYPRIATEIFFNISKILSDRLEDANRLLLKA
ncbi:MAG: MMPL family transporter [Candidatus Binatia bacterium]